MATITNEQTVEAVQHGEIVKYRFRFTFDNGEVHERSRWAAGNEATLLAEERSHLLQQLADGEARQLIEAD